MAPSHLIQAGKASALEVRSCAALSEAVLCATDPGAYFSKEQLSAFARVERIVKMTRYGGDCYLFAALALGFVDVVIEANFQRMGYRRADPADRRRGRHHHRLARRLCRKTARPFSPAATAACMPKR